MELHKKSRLWKHSRSVKEGTERQQIQHKHFVRKDLYVINMVCVVHTLQTSNVRLNDVNSAAKSRAIAAADVVNNSWLE